MSAPTIQTNPLPPAPSAVDLLDNTSPSLISQAWNQWLLQAQQKINVINEILATLSSGSITPEGALGVSSGGTGATTASVAFGNLSPLTTSGDMLIYNGGNIRLPISTNGFVLQIVAGIPTWVNPSAGSSPLTTKGDLYGYSTAPARIPVGSDTYVLTADSTNTLGVSWKPAGTPTLPVTTKGDILGYSTLPARIPVGIDGQVLLADSTQTLGVRWGAAGSSSPLTTKGDLYGFSTANARIPVGTDGQVLTGDSTSALGVSWGNPPNNYIIPNFSSVSSLLHFGGTSGSTTFTDQVVGNSWTAHNATISTAQSLFGGSSGLFTTSGANSCITLPSNSKFQLGILDWTLEISFYISATVGSNYSRLFESNTGDGISGINITILPGNVLSFLVSYSGSSWNINLTNVATLTNGVWYRLLIERAKQTILIFIDGYQITTVSIGSNPIYTTLSDVISIGGQSTGVNRALSGYIDEFRFTLGTSLVSSYGLTTSEFPNS